MSNKKSEKVDDSKLSTSEFSVSELVSAIFFSTYYLTVQIIELSLSSYVLEENHLELYQKYLIFKHYRSIWNWWHLFSSLTIPLSVFSTLRDLLAIFTKQRSIQRHSISIITAVQLFSVLYVIFIRIVPLEGKLIETMSKENLHELNSFHWIVFLLNLCGWFIPIICYRHAKNNTRIPANKKTQ